jgi:hypothetical protein
VLLTLKNFPSNLNSRYLNSCLKGSCLFTFTQNSRWSHKQRTFNAVTSDCKASFIDQGLIFSTSNGTPIDARNFNHHLKQLCIKAGIRIITPHVFRHTFITNAVKNNVDPRLLKRIVGHSSVEVADAIYTHLAVDDLRVAMDKIKTTRKTGGLHLPYKGIILAVSQDTLNSLPTA